MIAIHWLAAIPYFQSPIGGPAQTRRGTLHLQVSVVTTMIAVIGATGNTGRAVVRELRQVGRDPLCIVRSAEKARAVLGADARTAVAELTDKAALEKALVGAENVFLVTGHNPQMAEQQNNVIDAAIKAGAKYLVRISAGAAVAKPDSPTAVGRAHYAVDERLRGGNIGWVILRPSTCENTSAKSP